MKGNKMLLQRFENWDWDDTWELFGCAMLLTLAIGISYGIIMCAFFSGESRGFYIDSSTWYEYDSKGKYVVLDSTTMQKNRIREYYVKENLAFTSDPSYLQTFDPKEAQDFYFKLTSQKMVQQIKTQSISKLYEDLPFDEKVKFLTLIKMINLETVN